MGDALADIRAHKDGKKFIYDLTAEAVAFGNKTPAGGNCAKVGDFEKSAGEWNTIEVYAVGDSAVQVVNGHPMLRIDGSRRIAGDGFAPLTSGRLELEVEGWEIYFREIEIRPLKEIPADLSAAK
jgi:hypothetical protein